MHKTYAGLRDAWLYGKNEKAKKIFLKFCDWGVDVISNLDGRQMERMLDNEFGGMNEVYADAWQMTGNPKYLIRRSASHTSRFRQYGKAH